MNKTEFHAAQKRAQAVLAATRIVLIDAEAAQIEVADLGLNRLAVMGIELVTYINDDRKCFGPSSVSCKISRSARD